jgi:hypothetical protein
MIEDGGSIDTYDGMVDRKLGETIKVKMHCRYCNIGVFEAEINDEPDRWVAPKAPRGWETVTNPMNHTTVYRCPDCIRYTAKESKIVALAELGRPMEQGKVDQDFTDFDLGAIASWCKLILDAVMDELDKRHEAEPKKRGRRKE